MLLGIVITVEQVDGVYIQLVFVRVCVCVCVQEVKIRQSLQDILKSSLSCAVVNRRHRWIRDLVQSLHESTRLVSLAHIYNYRFSHSRLK